jgi:uncharacterized membrane protein YkvA (DUF1232 family)
VSSEGGPTGSSKELATRPDDDPRAQLKEYALFAPRLVKLVTRLMRDGRVPARQKAILVLVGVYLVSPVDFIPDFIPGLGHIDDLVLAAFALDQILNRVPEASVREHWDGDENVLQVVREILDIATGLVPDWVKKRLSV